MIEYISANLWQFWIVICMLCLILELFSGDFFLMCFAIGALVTTLVSLLGTGIYSQLVIFAVVSILSIFFVRPFAIKCLHSNEGRLSNAEALIGRTGTVSSAIPTSGYGRVAIDGDDWKANSADGLGIEKGAKVRIVSMDSIIITVERIN